VTEAPEAADSLPLDEDDRRRLLELARTSLERSFDLPAPGLEEEVESLPPRLLEPLGAFVSLHVDGQLRGCIGSIRASSPLARLVAELAVSAASRDYRFAALQAEELGRLTIEISVLGRPVEISSPDEIEVGRHGLIASRGPFLGLLLPQVAVHQAWDVPTFLSHTCDKAGLPPDDWRQWAAGRDPDFQLQIFTAQVFAEETPRA
jgi:AmmeMemoRadiSam system protein A